MARPLTKMYNPHAPYIVERQDFGDDEDGDQIQYEVVDTRPDSYRTLCIIHEDPEDRGQAKRDAELIASALNSTHMTRNFR